MLVAILTLAVTHPSPAQAWSGKPRIPGGSSWCGNSQAKDWACRWQGHAFSAGVNETPVLLPMRRPKRLFHGTRISTGSDGIARLAFLDEARCTVGGGKSDMPSEVEVRWESDVLMRQISGDSSCSMRNSRAPLETLCDPGKPCAAKIRARGTFLVQLPAPEVTASLTETFHRYARVVVCAGSIKVQAATETSSAEASGSASGNNRYVITVVESVERTEDETVSPTGTSTVSDSRSSISIEVVGTVRGPGRCASSSVQKQERSVTP
ncbi:MAG TPA: hypothetical protein VGV69_04670 [Solirubrobacterales bacterium]|nr:hypothetical protein [Solirubrobacterales bacterium]